MSAYFSLVKDNDLVHESIILWELAFEGEDVTQMEHVVGGLISIDEKDEKLELLIAIFCFILSLKLDGNPAKAYLSLGKSFCTAQSWSEYNVFENSAAYVSFFASLAKTYYIMAALKSLGFGVEIDLSRLKDKNPSSITLLLPDLFKVLKVYVMFMDLEYLTSELTCQYEAFPHRKDLIPQTKLLLMLLEDLKRYVDVRSMYKAISAMDPDKKELLMPSYRNSANVQLALLEEFYRKDISPTHGIVGMKELLQVFGYKKSANKNHAKFPFYEILQASVYTPSWEILPIILLFPIWFHIYIEDLYKEKSLKHWSLRFLGKIVLFLYLGGCTYLMMLILTKILLYLGFNYM
jgi:hypothetical protein